MKRIYLIVGAVAVAFIFIAPFIHYLITGRFPDSFTLRSQSKEKKSSYSRKDIDERRKKIEEFFNNPNIEKPAEKIKEVETLTQEARKKTEEKDFNSAVELMDKAIALFESLPRVEKVAPDKAFYLNSPRKIADDGADPSFNPDGKKIAFHSSNGQRELSIYVVNVDGTGRKLLIKDAADPSWGRGTNSNKIAFLSSLGRGEPGIWMATTDGTQRRLVVKMDVRNFAWSPDGRKLVFTHGRNIYTCDDNGENIKKLTDLSTDSVIDFVYPAFSPDGKKIVLSEIGKPFRDDSVGAVRLWTMNADGTDRKIVFEDKGTDFYVYQEGWSIKDKIIFNYHSAGEYAFLCQIDSAGRNKTIVANDLEYGLGDVAVSPDGKMIVFNKYKVMGKGKEASDEPAGLWIMELER